MRSKGKKKSFALSPYYLIINKCSYFDMLTY